MFIVGPVVNCSLQMVINCDIYSHSVSSIKTQ